jgi:hypothetical protein
VESDHYFSPFAESRITWIESAQPKIPIVHFRKNNPGRACAAGSGSVYGMPQSVFSKKIGEYLCCAGHYFLSVLFVS